MKQLLIVPLLIICLHLHAQKPLSGLFVGGDTLKTSPYDTFKLQALAWDGNTDSDYTYTWETVPQIKDQLGEDIVLGNSDVHYLSDVNPSSFKVICTVTDADNNSIRLEQYILHDYKMMKLYEENPSTHTFTGNDYVFDLTTYGNLLFEDPYSITVTGDGAPYMRIEEINNYKKYVFNSDIPKEYTLNFNLFYENEKIHTYTRLLIVGDTEKGP